MLYDFKCTECGCTKEYYIGIAFKDNIPEICQVCGKGKMEKQFSPQGIGFNIKGYCYQNVYGNHNWKNGKSAADIAEKYIPDSRGNYVDPY